MEKINIDILNGFTFIRIIAATLVLITHSYIILGLQGDLFERIGIIAFSKLGVDAFFVISGYLVTLSLGRNGSLLEFFKNRAIRILPGLAIAVLISVFIVGPLTSHDPSYFYRIETWLYLLNILIFKLQPYLPGVFVGQAVENVNGSLWTLPIEVLCYAMLIILAWADVVRARFLFLLISIMLILHLNDTFVRDKMFLTVPQLFLNELGYLFFSGAFFALIKKRLPVSWTITVPTAMVIASGYFFRGSDWHYVAFVYLLLWPYTIISSALLLKKLSFMNKFDISYGTYIYGFVIQQCLAFFFPSLKDPVLFAIFSIILSYGAGFASWKFVEKPCLDLKKHKYLSTG